MNEKEIDSKEKTLKFTKKEVELLCHLPFVDQDAVKVFLKNLKDLQELCIKQKVSLKEVHCVKQKKKGLEKNKEYQSVEKLIKDLDDLSLFTYITKNRHKLLQWIESETKNDTFRKSGHLIDQQLKYIKSSQNALGLFSSIKNKELKQFIDRDKEASEKSMEVGIQLNAAQDRLVNALCRLLHEKSQIFIPELSSYYTGNHPYTTVDYGKSKERIPTLLLSPNELYQAYLEKTTFSGKEISNIENLLEKTQNIRHLIIYEWKRKNASGKIVVDRVEQYQSLFAVDELFHSMSEEEAHLVSIGNLETRKKKKKFLIRFNPLFIHQIESKYVLYPKDIHQRMTLAVGGDPRKITPSMISLRDFCLRSLSNRQNKIELNYETLPFLLKMANYVRSGRKKEILKRITDSFQICKTIGLISSWVEKTGRKNQTKYVIYLNSKFINKN